MQKWVGTKEANKGKGLLYGGLDAHNWASKMEIHRLIGGRAELELKSGPQERVDIGVGAACVAYGFQGK